MKKYTLIIIITILIGLVTSCDNDENDFIQVEFNSIGQGNIYGNGVENIIKQNLVISDSNSWNELIIKMNSVNNVSESFTETNIDFSIFTVIAIFDEIRPNGGHSIDITKAMENENSIIVTIENILLGDKTLALTQPYHIVKIQRNDKSIIFE